MSASNRSRRRENSAERTAVFVVEADARRTRLLALVCCAAVAATAIAAAPHFVARWRLDSPTRFAGYDTVTTERAAAALERAVEGAPMAGSERRRLVAEAQRATLRDNPFSPLLWREAGSLLYLLGRTDEARAFLDMARRIDPLNPDLRYQIGNERLLREGPGAALGDYREAMRVDFAGGRGAHYAYWRLGIDPVFLLRALVPRRHAARRAYFEDAVGALAPGALDRVWALLLDEWDSTNADDRRAVARYLASLHERVRRAEGDEAVALVKRARARRTETLQHFYDLASLDQADWLAPAGADPASGLFNAMGRHPMLQLGWGDWQLPQEGHRQEVEVLRELPDAWPERLGDAAHRAEAVAPGRWFHVRFDEVGGRPVNYPAQTLLLDGPSSYSLTYEVATRGLFTAAPLHVEVTSWGRDPLGRVSGARRRGMAIGGERPPRRDGIEFYVLRAGEGPQVVRLVRAVGASHDPTLQGDVWFRFLALEAAPLPEGFVPRAVDSEEFLETIDRTAPSLLDQLDPEPKSDPGTGLRGGSAGASRPVSESAP